MRTRTVSVALVIILGAILLYRLWRGPAAEGDAGYGSGDPLVLLGVWDGPRDAELLEPMLLPGRQVLAVCSAVRGLLLVDVSEPTAPRVTGATGFAESPSDFPRCRHLTAAADGAVVYASNPGDEVQRRSFIGRARVADPAAPSPLPGALPGHDVAGIDLSGGLLAVAAHRSGLLLFDDPLQPPVRVPTDNARDVLISGERAYVADGVSGLAVVDISDPQEARLLGRVRLPGSARDLALHGDRLFAALGPAGVAALRIDARSLPTLEEVRDLSGSILAVAVDSGTDTLVAAAWTDLRILDLSDGLIPVGHEPAPPSDREPNRVMGVTARDGLAYVSAWRELAVYRIRPGQAGPDLRLSGRTVQLERPDRNAAPSVVRLRNVGRHPLELRAEASGTDLEVRGVPPSLEPGEDAWMEVAHRGRAPLVDAWVRLQSNDADEPEITLSVGHPPPRLAVGDDTGELSLLHPDGRRVRLRDLADGPLLAAYFNTF